MLRSILFLILLSLPCDAQESSGISRRLSTLQSYLDHLSDSGFCFSALIAVDGQIILQKGYGWTDSLHTTRATEHTLFNIASMTKSLTATAAFLLRSRNLLQLQDSLPQFFSNVPGDKRAITISQLLTHTSGLAQHYVADGVPRRDSAVHRILDDPLQFLPGTGFSYSNENYELLGAIIEVITRQRYEDALRTLILSKANMTETRFWAELPLNTKNVASMNRRLDSAVLVRNWGYIGSGGIYSDVVDLYSWFSTLMSGVLLDSGSLREMWTVRHQLPETGVSSGWFTTSSVKGQEIWTRGTEDWGHNGVLRWFPERKVVIIVLSNSGERGERQVTANRIISDGIARIILE